MDMPTYDFICNDCNQRFDIFLTFAEYGKKPVNCAHCNGKIAAIGFCMGGRIAFLAASRAGVDAAIGLYVLGIALSFSAVGLADFAYRVGSTADTNF